MWEINRCISYAFYIAGASLESWGKKTNKKKKKNMTAGAKLDWALVGGSWVENKVSGYQNKQMF